VMKVLSGFLVILVGVLSGAFAQTSRLPSRCFFCRCPRNQDPQCGSDGRTYSNRCILECAKQRCAEMTRGLTARAGACNTNPLLSAVKQAAAGNRPELGNQLASVEKLDEKCFNCRCSRIKNSQCGSDGRTYQNLCLLNCAKMRCPEQTAGVTARAGECDQSDQKQDKTEVLKLPSGCFQGCECPKWLDYQCGSDGRTYPNQCLLQCAQRKCPDYYSKGVNVSVTPGRCNRRRPQIPR